MDWPLRFGIFLPPMQPTGQNPTLALERNLDLIVHLDHLGYDEVWVGEHHSGGYEIIASPEVFIAVAAERTRSIRFGTGVCSLPYHHPFTLTDRVILLDHLTRGRVMFGVGPGQLTSDAYMLGIEPTDQRRMMEESLDAIVALLRSSDPVTIKTDWFTMNEARLQLRPYTFPHFEMVVAASISPSGPKAAGRHGLGLLSIAATNPAGFAMLAGHWQVMEDQAADHGTTVDRRKWRMMGPVYIAETVKQAKADCERNLPLIFDYLAHIIPVGDPNEEPPGSYDEMIDRMNETGSGVVGTPDMAIAQIERLQKESGGFGAFLMLGAELAEREPMFRSYELFAKEVMPHFQGQLGAPQSSYEWVVGAETEGGSTRWKDATINAIAQATQQYHEERATRT